MKEQNIMNILDAVGELLGEKNDKLYYKDLEIESLKNKVEKLESENTRAKQPKNVEKR